MMTREYIGMQEAATCLGVSRATIERLCLDGYLTHLRLPTDKDGRKKFKWLVQIESLEDVKREYTHEALPPEKRKGRVPILKAVR